MKARKKEKFHNRSHCWLTSDLIESDAFLKLSGKAAMLCLIRFHQKAYKKNIKRKSGGHKEPIITNNGEIIFTYSEARWLGIKTNRHFSLVVKELMEKGFIDISEPGNWYMKQPTKYSISYRWRKWGTDQYEPPKQKHSIMGYTQ